MSKDTKPSTPNGAEMVDFYVMAGSTLVRQGKTRRDLLQYEGNTPGEILIEGSPPDSMRTPAPPIPSYRQLRKHEYPAIEEQLQMIYDDLKNGTTTWQQAIAAVKAKHPKPVDQQPGTPLKGVPKKPKQ